MLNQGVKQLIEETALKQKDANRQYELLAIYQFYSDLESLEKQIKRVKEHPKGLITEPELLEKINNLVDFIKCDFNQRSFLQRPSARQFQWGLSPLINKELKDGIKEC